MEFDDLTITLLERRTDAPEFEPAERERLQDGHLAYLASLADAGQLVAAGPLSDPRFAGLSILRVSPEEALVLKGVDPAVRAGLYTPLAMQWLVPAGAVKFGPAHFPRSIAEATSRP